MSLSLNTWVVSQLVVHPERVSFRLPEKETLFPSGVFDDAVLAVKNSRLPDCDLHFHNVVGDEPRR